MRGILLACVVSALLCLASASMATERYGDFYYSGARADEFSDEPRDWIVTADEAMSTALGWKCLYDGVNVFLGIGRFLGGDVDDEIKVRYRIDKNSPSQWRYWKLSQDHKAAFMPMDDVASFTSASVRGNRIVIEAVDPLDGEVIRNHFSLRGLGVALGKLRCVGQ